MNMNPLPPQAYTKETLGKAFAWLQSQSENIKEMATSPDILVSLYLKAKLNGTGALERPSIQNFKSELKSLAGMMGEFEVMDQTPKLEARVQADLQQRQSHETLPAPSALPLPTATTASIAAFDLLPPLDEKSRSMIQEVKNELNLSTELEALRLLISAGYKNLKKL